MVLVTRVIPLPFEASKLPLTARKQADAYSAGTAPGVTHPMGARPLVTLMEHLATCSKLKPAQDRPDLTRDIATLGALLDATRLHPATGVNIVVPYVVHHPTLHNSVKPPPEFLIINTPFKPDKWENMLNNI